MAKKGEVRVFGVRHHGPGCARALLAAFDAFQPQVVLVEGPPDADAIVHFATDPAMRPPVALLVYPTASPQASVFYPFADFSPEWQAIVWARQREVAVRFCDLPMCHRLAPAPEAREAAPGAEIIEREAQPAIDPHDLMARVAGFDDREVWWDHFVESRRDLAEVFEAVAVAAAEMRAASPPPAGLEAQREAHMRTAIRDAQRRAGRVAVVCGAWHAPALQNLSHPANDKQVLAGLPKVKVTATWIPWTHSRLSFRSGYGAGIDAPGWYQCLFRDPARAAAEWTARAARLLRRSDLEAPPANVVDAVRLANALAALRGRSTPGLLEIREAIQTVLCRGQAAPIALIRDQLEVGSSLGAVPASAPAVPLQRDLEASAKKLRLKASEIEKILDLDLRKPLDRDRSEFLHRLTLLRIPWGQPHDVAGCLGTFHEFWQLRWQVDFAVAIVEANVWGNTIEEAATARAADDARSAALLSEIAALLDAALLADLPTAIEATLARLQAVSAATADILQLLEAIAPLARILRYGDVRRTRADRVEPILASIVRRVLVGLPVACRGIDDDTADRLTNSIDELRGRLRDLERSGDLDELLSLLDKLANDSLVHAGVRGFACRTLLAADRLTEPALLPRASSELSPVVDPLQAGAWLKGLLSGGTTGLLQLRGLWAAINHWLVHVRPDAFLALLPILRRAFAHFEPAERRRIMDLIRQLTAGNPVANAATPAEPELDVRRAALPLPVLRLIMGLDGPVDRPIPS